MNSTSGINKAQKKIIHKLQQAIDFLNANQLAQARAICRQLCKTNAKLADAWHILALVEKQDGQLKSAVYAFDKAIKLNPTQANYLYNFAVTYHQAGMIDSAISFYQRCLQQQPQHAAALDNLGALLQQKYQFDQALSYHQQAIAIQPGPYNLNNLGECYRNLGDTEAALAAYQRALAFEPGFINALKNMGNLYKETGQFEQAERCLEQAVSHEHLASGNYGVAEADAVWNQAMLLLLQGRFQSGWLKYESGIQQGTRTFVDYQYPTWSGQKSDHLSLLIICEQGIGDEIMFASCFDDAIQAFRQVTIECDPRLIPIFTRSFPQVTLLARGDERTTELLQQQRIDYQIPAGSLPAYFRRHQDDFPQHDAYLTPDSDLVNNWRQRLSQLGDGLKVGIAWRGGKIPMTIKKRSTPLSLWQQVLQTPATQFVNLQYGDCSNDIDWVQAQWQVSIHDFEDIDSLRELDNYAALIASLDLVLSIDNSVVHLAGALGKKTWVMLPYIPDWRWQMDVETSVWYPSIRLFRQTRKDDWQPVFAQVTEQLAQVRKDQDWAITETTPGRVGKSRLLLINDTSAWYHWGCTCTSQALLKQFQLMGYITDSIPIQDCLERVYTPNRIEDCLSDEFQADFIKNNQGLFDKIETSDVVVLNGEGSMHGRSSSVLMLLLLIRLAKTQFGKSVHIINHSCYPDDKPAVSDNDITRFYQSIYQQMDSIAIREPVSAQLMRELGVSVTQSFDCLPLYLRQNQIKSHSKKTKTVVISGSVALTGQAIEQLTQLMQKLHQQGYSLQVLTGARAYPAKEDQYLVDQLRQALTIPWQWVEAKSATEWLNTIAEAFLLISGRFHFSIAAACLKTPFIALTSNTAKMSGMLSMLNLPEPIALDSDALADLLFNDVQTIAAEPEARIVSDNTLAHIEELSMQNFAAFAYDQAKDSVDAST